MATVMVSSGGHVGEHDSYRLKVQWKLPLIHKLCPAKILSTALRPATLNSMH